MSQWVDGYDHAPSTERAERNRRVRWLLHEADPSIGNRHPRQRLRRDAYRVLMLGIAFGAIATTLVIIGISSGDGTQPVLAVGGWISILASITCTIIYVFRLSSAADPPLRDDEIERAGRLASALDRQPASSNR